MMIIINIVKNQIKKWKYRNLDWKQLLSTQYSYTWKHSCSSQEQTSSSTKMCSVDLAIVSSSARSCWSMYSLLSPLLKLAAVMPCCTMQIASTTQLRCSTVPICKRHSDLKCSHDLQSNENLDYHNFLNTQLTRLFKITKSK